ncbi:hypothetical protein [Parasphingopyxis sp.]|uniref:hypothetical protein n=1 Tax=Parasphingopyxis sp. TaxID=1920299 RepID=UPI00262BEE88|nr:hypothetical protein [Parasphingopyxis sp.]
MRRFDTMMIAGALIGLSTNGVAQPSDSGGVLWAEVCGRPDMRIAIELGNDRDQEERRDCAEACHAALCRKTIDTIKKGDGQGALV